VGQATPMARSTAHVGRAKRSWSLDKRAQFRANWNPPQNSTCKRWIVSLAQGEGEKRPCLKHLLGEGSKPGGSLAPLELEAA
jgi:hypothetical protein